MKTDPHIQYLVDTLNSIPGVATNSSCEGHKNPKDGQCAFGTFNVDMDIEESDDGWISLNCIVACLGDKGRLSPWLEDESQDLRWDLSGEYKDKRAY